MRRVMFCKISRRSSDEVIPRRVGRAVAATATIGSVTAPSCRLLRRWRGTMVRIIIIIPRRSIMERLVRTIRTQQATTTTIIPNSRRRRLLLPPSPPQGITTTLIQHTIITATSRLESFGRECGGRRMEFRHHPTATATTKPPARLVVAVVLLKGTQHTRSGDTIGRQEGMTAK